MKPFVFPHSVEARKWLIVVILALLSLTILF